MYWLWWVFCFWDWWFRWVYWGWFLSFLVCRGLMKGSMYCCRLLWFVYWWVICWLSCEVLYVVCRVGWYVILCSVLFILWIIFLCRFVCWCVGWVYVLDWSFLVFGCISCVCSSLVCLVDRFFCVVELWWCFVWIRGRFGFCGFLLCWWLVVCWECLIFWVLREWWCDFCVCWWFVVNVLCLVFFLWLIIWRSIFWVIEESYFEFFVSVFLRCVDLFWVFLCLGGVGK